MLQANKLTLRSPVFFFSKSVPQGRRANIINELDIKEVLAQDKCLGLSTHIDKSNKKVLSIKDRIGKRLSQWMDKLISWAGREVFIKAVAQAITTYAMSVFKLPKDIVNPFTFLSIGFGWGHDPTGRKIHWVSGMRLCLRKDAGGLGFRDLQSFNDVLLAKQLWRLVQDESTLVFKLVKSRYFSHWDILDANLGSRPSFSWRSIWGA